MEMAGLGLKVKWDRVSLNHQGGVNGVSQTDGDSHLLAAYAFKGRPTLLSGIKAALPAQVLKPHNSVPPRISQAPFELLPQQWSSE